MVRDRYGLFNTSRADLEIVLVRPSAERRYETVSIVLVGKYVTLQDSYMSVVKSLEHASMRCGKKLNLQWVDSSNLEPEAETADPVKYHDAWRAVCSAKGIIVPGGFGHRGTEGMVAAVKWAREKKVPFLGICLGFQIAVIEWARNVCVLNDAHSAELAPETPHPVIVFMPEISKTHLGGTMRLGLRPTLFESGTEKSKLRQLYGGEETIWERHRHRYEVGPEYVERLEQPGGMRFIGKDERGERMQVLEMDGRSSARFQKHRSQTKLNRKFPLSIDHPYFVGLQAHPEFCTRPLNPSPPFLGLIAAACGKSELDAQISRNAKEYRDPHPDESKVIPAREPASELGQGKPQEVRDIKVVDGQ